LDLVGVGPDIEGEYSTDQLCVGRKVMESERSAVRLELQLLLALKEDKDGEEVAVSGRVG